MKRFRLFLVFSFLVNSFVVLAQVDEEEYLNSLLREEVKVENPVYKPVLGFGLGILNFHGDVNNNNRSATFGTIARADTRRRRCRGRGAGAGVEQLAESGVLRSSRAASLRPRCGAIRPR